MKLYHYVDDNGNSFYTHKQYTQQQLQELSKEFPGIRLVSVDTVLPAEDSE